MSSQPLLLPEVRIDDAELRAALQSVAIPGYNGSLTVEIGLREVKDEFGARYIYIAMSVLRRESKRMSEPAGQRQILPDPERRKPVDKVIEAIRPKLFIRPVLRLFEVHFKNGVASDYAEKSDYTVEG